MTNVLVVHASSDLYGSDLACLAVVEGLTARGWGATVTVPRPGPLVPLLENAGAAVIELDPLKFRRVDLRPRQLPSTVKNWSTNLVALRRLGRERRFDLVYTTTAPTTGGSILARRWRVPHAYHVHEIFWYPAPLVRAFEALLRTADVVLCCSAAVASQFASERVRARTRVVHTGATVDANIRPAELFASSPTVVTCVARLNEWKGQEILVEAADLVRRKHPIVVRLIGDVYGSEIGYRTRLERMVDDLGLHEVVVLEGERRDAQQLVAEGDISVLPSRRAEPFGMALVEAMALGRPCVATSAGGPLEIVRHGVDGLLVPPGDAPALAEAIVSLIENPALARSLGANARERAASFRIEAMVEGVLASFDDLLAPQR